MPTRHVLHMNSERDYMSMMTQMFVCLFEIIIFGCINLYVKTQTVNCVHLKMCSLIDNKAYFIRLTFEWKSKKRENYTWQDVRKTSWLLCKSNPNFSVGKGALNRTLVTVRECGLCGSVIISPTSRHCPSLARRCYGPSRAAGRRGWPGWPHRRLRGKLKREKKHRSRRTVCFCDITHHSCFIFNSWKPILLPSAQNCAE